MCYFLGQKADPIFLLKSRNQRPIIFCRDLKRRWDNAPPLHPTCLIPSKNQFDRSNYTYTWCNHMVMKSGLNFLREGWKWVDISFSILDLERRRDTALSFRPGWSRLLQRSPEPGSKKCATPWSKLSHLTVLNHFWLWINQSNPNQSVLVYFNPSIFKTTGLQNVGRDAFKQRSPKSGSIFLSSCPLIRSISSTTKMRTRFPMRTRPFLLAFPTPLPSTPDRRWRTSDLVATISFLTGSTARTISGIFFLPFLRKGFLFVWSPLLSTRETTMDWAETVDARLESASRTHPKLKPIYQVGC